MAPEKKLPDLAIILFGHPIDNMEWENHEIVKGLNFYAALIDWGLDPSNIKIFAPGEYFPDPTPPTKDGFLEYLNGVEKGWGNIFIYTRDYTPISPEEIPNVQPGDPVIRLNEGPAIQDIFLQEYIDALNHLSESSNNVCVICNGRHSGSLAFVTKVPSRIHIGSLLYYPDPLTDVDLDLFDYGLGMQAAGQYQFHDAFLIAEDECKDQQPQQDPIYLPRTD